MDALSGRSYELAEALKRRRTDLRCKRTTSDVGVIVSERFQNAIAKVEEFSDRLMKIVAAVQRRIHHLFSAYALQTGCSERDKDEFWSLPVENTADVPSLDVIVDAGDPNGHDGAKKTAVMVVWIT
ncbi:unnamed protein product [Heligmosomoides polygyrus]|uniref:Rx_N domain-containing protein n=1 Tax=Heligmosomoides polygyrus TaxID=6339 RepID=A0A183G9C9_HELPZ|nr:unnamed protein product [Heligmosomoides polygyrus]